MSSHQEDYMKVSGMFRAAIPVVVASAALALAGCETMSSAWDSTKAMFSGSNVTLSGAEEVPPVTTSASGSGTITVKDDRSVSGSFKLQDAAQIRVAHIHVGPAGKNGPIIIPLQKTADNEWVVPAGAKLTESQYQSYKAGGLYVNFHSAQYKGGEIRGQLKP
jgi:hypothetical protein